MTAQGWLGFWCTGVHTDMGLYCCGCQPGWWLRKETEAITDWAQNAADLLNRQKNINWKMNHMKRSWQETYFGLGDCSTLFWQLSKTIQNYHVYQTTSPWVWFIHQTFSSPDVFFTRRFLHQNLFFQCLTTKPLQELPTPRPAPPISLHFRSTRLQRQRQNWQLCWLSHLFRSALKSLNHPTICCCTMATP